MITDIGKCVRFAPSSNGYLHRGHAYSALLNWQFSQDYDAEFLLRMEDIDITRSKPEFVDAIFEDLRWLGLDWPEPVLFQSSRFEAYQATLQNLIERDLVYPAFLSRKDINSLIAIYENDGIHWPIDPDGSPHYPGKCKELSRQERKLRILNGEAHNWRLDMRAVLDQLGQDVTWVEFNAELKPTKIEASPEAWGDVVIARRDIPTSYHLSVVLDDAEQGVDFVIRGKDLYHSTSIHRVLQILLNLPAPNYRHHDLIMADEHFKLSKSDGSQSLKDLREKKNLTRTQLLKLIHL
ncbi:tRNA glutamyl-Q(34) synthetase GluQRS [Lentilitoribacter sp. Alg239-R112]|uniref:tRNA glutamyl-Q(34) synthetase GluQRS n=1 Tax=Lentilitoribacter sp. Alg239-R112 TaxID=2305987 RepID=UPI0013A6B0A7|nr:tRNA glutamyl-Q(34) synthetase GluQRS [Lentilitoribacter sp. Alg239-R112]